MQVRRGWQQRQRKSCVEGRVLPALVLFLLLIGFCAAHAQSEYEITIETTLGDTTETFWLQIPAAYDPSNPCPLLIGWHQWGGNHWELKQATDFDEIANERGWIAACHHGISTTHWNNHSTQSHVVDVIAWIQENYCIDESRIYMIGSSMGGAAGMVFSNNHLDPAGPMVAAAASVSGIQDCERRFHEQGINNSMIAAFGGTPDEVPYEYHRNSAIYFADSTESMHFNARHLPLFLTFGHAESDQVWREHAEDLYAVMEGWADTVVIRESALYGHGWGCAEEELICDFLESFVLERYPTTISVNADEEGRWYWAELEMHEPLESFARIESTVDVVHAHLDLTMLRNVSAARLDLPSIGFPYDRGSFSCGWAIRDGAPAQLVFLGVSRCPLLVLRDGVSYGQWTYDAGEETLALDGEDEALYVVVFDAATAPAAPAVEAEFRGVPVVRVWASLGGVLHYDLRAAGRVSWALYDPRGRAVAAEVLGWRAAGRGRISFARRLPSGIYFARIWVIGCSASESTCRVTAVR
jgi:poly(3-hydroxybutyrate) depolymerase